MCSVKPKADSSAPADDDSRGSSSRISTAGNRVMVFLAIATLGYAGYSITDQVRDHQSGRQILGGDWYAGFDDVPQTKKAGDSDEVAATRDGNVIERDGKTLLWSGNDPQSGENTWFDITDGLLDWRGFQYGLGKDTIPAIDKGVFLAANDPRLLEYAINDDSVVLGYAHNGQARAYPIGLLTGRELVNDTVGGKPVTVGW